jgi:hypothetical protein
VAVSLYRQLQRSARQYAAEAGHRGLKMGGELPRLLALPSAAEHSAAVAAASSETATATAASALSAQMDHWIREKPFLFHHLIIANRKQQQRQQQQGQASAAASVSAATATAAISASSPGKSAIANAASVSASTVRPAAAAAAALGTAPAADADSSSAAAPPRPAAPAWVQALRRSGASAHPLQRSLLSGLLRRAFRLRSGDGREVSTRLSHAFALSKRLAERTAELRLLPQTPLRSWSAAAAPGLVAVTLRSQGVFKRVRQTHYFHLHWRVRNISADRSIVLVQRKIITHQRAVGSGSGHGSGHGSGGGVSADSSSPAMTVGVGMGSAGLGSGLGGVTPLGQRCTSTTLPASATPHRAPLPPPSAVSAATSTIVAPASSSGGSGGGLGLRVESVGVGLSGRAVGLPAGSSIDRQRVLIGVDGSSGTVAVELTFHDVTTAPPRVFTVQLPLLLLDAAADWMGALEDEEQPPEDDEWGAEEAAARSRSAQPTTRHMLSSAWRAEADRIGRAEQDRAAAPPSGDDKPVA